MKKLSLFAVVLTCICSGCTLDDVVSHGKTRCEAAYIQTSVGKCQVSGNNGSLDCEAHINAVKAGYCPVDYDACSADQSGVMFCHTACGESQVYCGEQCIDPGSSMTHCGAKGACIDSESASEDYMGAECTGGLTCKSGVCSSDNGCPKGEHKNGSGTCEADSFEHCGLDTNNCANLGIASGECVDGTCQAKTCSVGYHMDGSVCKADTNSCCGQDCTDCGTKQCVQGVCGLVNACEANEHVNSETGECDANTVQECGSINCTMLDGWKDGSCEVDKCVSSECKAGYHLNNGGCVEDSKECCGDACVPCEENQSCIGGTCTLSECDKGKEALCTSSEGAPECRPVLDDALNCGGCDSVCADVARTNAPVCVEGKCSYTCQSGLEQCGTAQVPDCRDIKNSADNCGKCDKKCSDSQFCDNGECKNKTCGDGLHKDPNSGNCVADTAKACGEHLDDCSAIEHADAECKGGKCVINKCDSEFHPNGSICESDSTDKCGSNTDNCKAINFRNEVACEDGKCLVKSCQVGYHPNKAGTECEADSAEACGQKGASCMTAAVTKAQCTNGLCDVTECKVGYHRSTDGTVCDADTVKACGSTAKDCTKTNGWKYGGCVDGGCIPVQCSDPYTYALVNSPYGKAYCQKINYSGAACGRYLCSSDNCIHDKNEYGMPYCSGYSGCPGIVEYGMLRYCGGTYNGSAWNWSCQSMKGVAYCIDVTVDCEVDSDSGWHYTEEGLCEENTLNDCGSPGFSCSDQIPGWKEGVCIGAFCSATECQNGYKRVKAGSIYEDDVYLCEPTFKIE